MIDDIEKYGDLNKLTSYKLTEILSKLRGFKVQHSTVMRDIRSEITQTTENVIDTDLYQSIFIEKTYEMNGRLLSYFEMTKKGWLQMAVRYDAKTRYAIIHYIMELENKLSAPKSFSDALFLAAEQQKAIEALKETADKQNKLIEHSK